MSERMIELHRARLLAAGKGSKTGGGPLGASLHQNGSQGASHQLEPQQTPRQAAVAAMQSEDMQMKRFLQRLQHQRDDSRPGEASFGPTVPTALSRRMLQRQGAGYLDSTVAAVTSAAADRFLATVVQQAVACRDQRLKGAEIARQAARKRKRHKQQYQDDADDRIRRKEEREANLEDYNLAAIEAADALTQRAKAPLAIVADGGKSEDGDEGDVPGSATKAKKKRKAVDSSPSNGLKRKAKDLSDDEASYDSIDEEEKYYQEYYNDDIDDDANSEDEYEGDDETMILRDLARPLEAWDFRFEGKRGMDRDSKPDLDTNDDGDSSEGEILNGEDDHFDSEQDEPFEDSAIENGGSDDGMAVATPKPSSATKKAPSKSPDDKRKPAGGKSSASPVPGNAQGTGS